LYLDSVTTGTEKEGLPRTASDMLQTSRKPCAARCAVAANGQRLDA
jgi:hypothetical protein